MIIISSLITTSRDILRVVGTKALSQSGSQNIYTCFSCRGLCMPWMNCCADEHRWVKTPIAVVKCGVFISTPIVSVEVVIMSLYLAVWTATSLNITSLTELEVSEFIHRMSPFGIPRSRSLLITSNCCLCDDTNMKTFSVAIMVISFRTTASSNLG
jgi:hypothetical protein